MSEVGMHSLETRSPEWCEVLRKNADLVNLPEVGAAGNVAYPTLQLNISPAVSWKSCTCISLEYEESN